MNHLTSANYKHAIAYYDLPFCKPREGIKSESENLGELVQGNKIENSPYRIHMKKDVYCEQICVSKLGRSEARRISPSKIVRAIRRHYKLNWVVDNLPSVAGVEDEFGDVSYVVGFPMGFLYEGRSYINNHVNIMLEYHRVGDDYGKGPDSASKSMGQNDDAAAEMDYDMETQFRIVKFTVEPLSIAHNFVRIHHNNDDDGDFLKDSSVSTASGGSKIRRAANITNPIPSCDPTTPKSLRRHTMYDMVFGENIDGPGPQPASRNVLFTYDVIWKENRDLSWTSRWDIYLNLIDAEDIVEEPHWLSISNSLVILFVVTSMVTSTLIHNIKYDFEMHCQSVTDFDPDYEDEFNVYAVENEIHIGWTLIQSDVFRAPKYPMMLCVLCGTGVQILGMTLLTIICSMLGTYHPDQRQTLALMLVLSYVFNGGLAGYLMSCLYKSFHGSEWRKAAAIMSLAFPSFVFLIISIMNGLALKQSQSHVGLSFGGILLFLALWLGVSTPLVFLGSKFGFEQDMLEYPVNTSTIPRQIPRQPWFMSPLTTSAGASLISFISCFIELANIMSSIWVDEYYYVFGFLLLTFFCLMTTCAEMAVLVNYFQLRSEDYRWWWRSFAVGGSVAIYIFGYSLYYIRNLQANNAVAYIFYVGYMGLSSLSISLMTGTVGVIGSLAFNHKMFQAFVTKSLKLS